MLKVDFQNRLYEINIPYITMIDHQNWEFRGLVSIRARIMTFEVGG